MSFSDIIVAEAYTAVAGNDIQADTTGGAFTITLPATASIGDAIRIEDAKLYWNTNNLTVARNGLNLNGGTSDYVASVQGNKLSVVYELFVTGTISRRRHQFSRLTTRLNRGFEDLLGR